MLCNLHALLLNNHWSLVIESRPWMALVLCCILACDTSTDDWWLSRSGMCSHQPVPVPLTRCGGAKGQKKTVVKDL